jgi:hypothetical protein
VSDGAWGSVRHHKREVVRVPARRRCPFCSGKVRATHAGQCNGVVMVMGCQWHMRVWARDGRIVPHGGRLVNEGAT